MRIVVGVLGLFRKVEKGTSVIFLYMFENDYGSRGMELVYLINTGDVILVAVYKSGILDSKFKFSARVQ